MRWRNTETPTFIGSRGTRNSGPDVVEILELLDRNGNVVATFSKAVDGSGSLALTGDLSVSEPIAQDQIEGTLVQILASVSVNLNQGTAAKQPLYTVPAGKILILCDLVFRGFSAPMTTAVLNFGYNSAADDIITGSFANALNTQLTSAISGTNYFFNWWIDQNTVNQFLQGLAGEIFGLKVTTPEGSPLTATVDVFGYLVPA